MQDYTVTWMDDDHGILATTKFKAADLGDALLEAFQASSREDGLGATQAVIELENA